MRGSHVADGESIDTEDKDLGLHIRAVPLFSTWPESALSALRKGARLTSAPAGSTVILQTYPVHGVYSIVEGSIEVGSTQAAGRRFIRRFAKPGTLFGLVSVLDGKGSPYTYLAHTKVLLLYVERTALLAALSEEPGLWRDIALHLAAFQRMALSVLDERVFEGVSVRLARALLELAASQGGRRAAREPVTVSTTQEELAGLLGVSRQSVSSELRRWANKGMISIGYRKIEILSPENLTSTLQASE